MIPQTTHVPVPWSDLNPRAPQREQGEKPITLTLGHRICFECYLHVCAEEEGQDIEDCPLRVLGMVDENGMLLSEKTWKRKRRMG